MNNLGQLNGFLFEQLERLNDSELKGEELREEIERSKAVGGMAKSIIENGSLALEAEKFKDDRMDADGNNLKMLGE